VSRGFGTDGGTDPDDLVPIVHQLLLRLVGRVPDEALWAGRDILFAGCPRDLAGQLGRLGELVAGPAADRFQDIGAPLLIPRQGLAGRPPIDDRFALQVVQASADAVGLWACWVGGPAQDRTAGDQRWYVVEAASAEGVLRLDRLMHEQLSGQRPRPRVAVIGPRGANCPMVSRALSLAPLVWAREPATALRIAPLFAGLDAEAFPRGTTGDPLPVRERQQVLAYLMSAEVVMRAARPAADLLDERRSPLVPIDLRCDGRWLWSDATAYYLAVHGVRPCDDLLRHVRAAGDRAPALTSVSHHRAVQTLGDLVMD
jgi:hypothetical protein